MKWTVIGVGRLKEPFYRDGCAEYLGRLQRKRAVACLEVEEVAPKAGDSTRSTRAEGERLRKLAGNARIVALTERGDLLSTQDLARRLEQFEREPQDLAFLLGGPDGLDPDLERAADWRLSLSPLTLPYQLARLVLLEQLYRVESLRRREPYHRGDLAETRP